MEVVFRSMAKVCRDRRDGTVHVHFAFQLLTSLVEKGTTACDYRFLSIYLPTLKTCTKDNPPGRGSVLDSWQKTTARGNCRDGYRQHLASDIFGCGMVGSCAPAANVQHLLQLNHSLACSFLYRTPVWSSKLCLCIFSSHRGVFV